MRCLNCKGDTYVSGTRATKHNGLRRRRICQVCGHRFTTVEAAVDDAADVVGRYANGVLTDQQLHRLRQGLAAVQLDVAYPLLEALARARYVLDEA